MITSSLVLHRLVAEKINKNDFKNLATVSQFKYVSDHYSILGNGVFIVSVSVTRETNLMHSGTSWVVPQSNQYG